jgi:hypothetical protein
MTGRKSQEIDNLWREKKIKAREIKEEIESDISLFMVYVDPIGWPKFKVRVSFFDSAENPLEKSIAERVVEIFIKKLGIKISFCLQHHEIKEDFLRAALRLVPRWKAEIEAETLEDLKQCIVNFLEEIPKMEKEYQLIKESLIQDDLKNKYRHPREKIGSILKKRQRQKALESFI